MRAGSTIYDKKDDKKPTPLTQWLSELKLGSARTLPHYWDNGIKALEAIVTYGGKLPVRVTPLRCAISRHKSIYEWVHIWREII